MKRPFCRPRASGRVPYEMEGCSASVTYARRGCLVFFSFFFERGGGQPPELCAPPPFVEGSNCKTAICRCQRAALRAVSCKRFRAGRKCVSGSKPPSTFFLWRERLVDPGAHVHTERGRRELQRPCSLRSTHPPEELAPPPPFLKNPRAPVSLVSPAVLLENGCRYCCSIDVCVRGACLHIWKAPFQLVFENTKKRSVNQ